MIVPQQTNNHYLMVRHGESTANVRGLVVTDPSVGCFNYGLTQKGKHQAEQAALSVLEILRRYNFTLSNVCVYHSDFKRTRETAELLGYHLSLKLESDDGAQNKLPVISSELLRERRFGELDQNDGISSYETIWKYDKMDADHTKHGVESVNQTLTRIMQFIEETEGQNNGKVIIIVSHGDVCQIMQTWFEGVDPKYHHDLPYIQNAEVRDLTAIARNHSISKL